MNARHDSVMKMNRESVGKSKEGKDYELVPPEGGWGFVVCIGLTASFIAATAHLPCLGFLYQEFLEDQGDSTGALASVQGVFSFMTAMAGFSTNIALKHFSLRAVGLFGAVLLTLGSLLGIFVQTTFQLIITNGVIEGSGLGIMLPILYTSYNSYFTVKKVLYLSLCKAGIGLAIMLYPLLLRITMEEFGFRGTLAIICAITAHSIAGALVMHPVSWHMVKKPKTVDVIVVIPPTPAPAENGKENNVFHFKIIAQNDSKTNEDTQHSFVSRSAENLKPLLILFDNKENNSEYAPAKASLLSPKTCERRSSTPVVSLASRRRSSMLRALDEEFDSNDVVYMQNVYKAVSMSSLGNFGMEPLPPIKNKQGRWQTVVEYLDLSFLKDPIYTNIAIGLSFSFFADLMFFALEPMLLNHYQFDKRQQTNIISIGGATDMAGKLALGLVGQFFRNVNSRHIFYWGSLLAAFIRTGFMQFSAYLPVAILTGILGLVRSMVHITMPLVIAAHVPIERYPSAYGLCMLTYGVVNITVGPAIGIVRDLTGSYALAFHLLSACNLMCVVPWTVEAIVVYLKKRTSKR